MPIDALSVLCAKLTRDLLAIAKFLSIVCNILFSFNTYIRSFDDEGRQ